MVIIFLVFDAFLPKHFDIPSLLFPQDSFLLFQVFPSIAFRALANRIFNFLPIGRFVLAIVQHVFHSQRLLKSSSIERWISIGSKWKPVEIYSDCTSHNNYPNDVFNTLFSAAFLSLLSLAPILVFSLFVSVSLRGNRFRANTTIKNRKWLRNAFLRNFHFIIVHRLTISFECNT